jgi:hypothetical protein
MTDRPSLSRTFQENAKDDRRAELLRAFDRLPSGGEVFATIEQQGRAELERRQRLEIEQTEQQRFGSIVQEEIRRRGAAPEPGRQTHPLTPAEYQDVKKEAARLLVEDTTRRQSALDQETQQQVFAVAERTLQRMQRMQLGEGQGRDQGRGMGPDDL